MSDTSNAIDLVNTLRQKLETEANRNLATVDKDNAVFIKGPGIVRAFSLVAAAFNNPMGLANTYGLCVTHLDEIQADLASVPAHKEDALEKLSALKSFFDRRAQNPALLVGNRFNWVKKQRKVAEFNGYSAEISRIVQRV